MRLEYQILNGSYYLFDADEKAHPLTGRSFRLMTDVVAIAFRKDDGSLLNHGSPAAVEAFAQKKRTELQSAGLHEWAEAITVMAGAFPVEEINKCISTSGYCRVLFDKLSKLVPAKDPVPTRRVRP